MLGPDVQTTPSPQTGSPPKWMFSRGGFRLWKPRGWPEGSEKRGESTRTRWGERNRGPGDSKQGLFFRTLGRAWGGGAGVLLSLCLVPPSGCEAGQDFLPVPIKLPEVPKTRRAPAAEVPHQPQAPRICLPPRGCHHSASGA